MEVPVIIYLVRHGESEDNANGIVGGRREARLTARGIAQVESTAAYFARQGIRPSVTYTSNQVRAVATAEIITTKLFLPSAMIKSSLKERDLGDITGMRKESIGAKTAGDMILGHDNRRFILAPKGGETFPQVIERGQKILDYTRINHAGESVLLVTHAITGLMIMATYYGIRWEEALRKYRLGNASITVLDRDTRPQNATIYEPH
jgi:broad specificity phosphatase PhoE